MSRLWTIGSGKGGVGNSFLAAFMGATLARAGSSVVLVDANLTAPDLHAYLGTKPPVLTLLDVLKLRVTLTDALMPTPEPQMHFLSCVGDEVGMADLAPGNHQKMADCISSLEADFVLVDVGSGASLSVLDFFNLAHEAVVVTPPDPVSMRCAYRFIRNSTYRRVQEQFGPYKEVSAAFRQMRQSANPARPWTMTEFLDLLRPAAPQVAQGISAMLDYWQPFLLVNMATSEQDQRCADIIQSAARKFLSIDMRACGLLHFDPNIRRTAQGANLPALSEPESAFAQQIRQLTLRLGAKDAAADKIERVGPPEPAGPSPAMGLNDHLAVLGRALHVQTEDLGAAGHYITTQVFCDGRVILSTKSDYPPTMQNPNDNGQVVELMRAQHFNVIRQIESRKTRIQSASVR